MKINTGFWKNKRVLVTGHTGFKGAWLIALMNSLGAETHGLALPAASDRPNLHTLGVRPNGEDLMFDIRDTESVSKALDKTKPDIVFHMAAQALVLPSYSDPIGTFATNVMGTVNVAMAALRNPNLKVFVNITSDKCYENKEWHWPYRENDPMGGYDPYSASKGCAEIAASSLRRSFFDEKNVCLASVRAGNVIGGGDWALHRIVPDLMMAFAKGQPAILRNPKAIRPWQHVLEPLRAYVQLAQLGSENRALVSHGWNIGPDVDAAQTVEVLARKASALWGSPATYKVVESPDKKHEAKFLKLDTSLIRGEIGWRPLLNFDQSMAWTVEWYKGFYAGQSAIDLCDRQIKTCLERDASSMS